MALHLNPNSLRFNLRSSSLPTTFSPSHSPPNPSNGVQILVAPPPLSVSDLAANSSLSPSASRGQIYSPEGFSFLASFSPELPHSLLDHGHMGTAGSTVHFSPAISGTGNGQSCNGFMTRSGFTKFCEGSSTLGNSFATQPAFSPRGKFSESSFFEDSAPVPVGPIIRAGLTINVSQASSSTLRQISATSGTGKGKSPAIPAPLSPTQSQGDASRFFQAAQLDAVHVAGPSRSAVHFVSGSVTNQGTNGLFHGPEGPLYQGPLSPSVNTAQSANASSSPSVVVNILTMLSQTQIEQAEKINNVSNDNFNLSRDLILLKHEANRRIDIADKAGWNEINAVNWRAKALAAQRDRTDQIFPLVIAERDERFDKLVTGLNDLKEQREKEEAKEAEKKEKNRKFWNYTLIGVGGALLVGVSVAAAILGRK